MRACGFEGLAGLGRNISRLARKPRLVAGALSYQRRSFLTRPLQTGRKTYDARFRRSRQLIGILRGSKPSFFVSVASVMMRPLTAVCVVGPGPLLVNNLPRSSRGAAFRFATHLVP
jgi:hypothetical protein